MGVTVERWISYDEAETRVCIPWNGGWSSDFKTWNAYIDSFPADERPYLLAIKDDVVRNRLRLFGHEHQEGASGVPLFSDGKVLTLTQRSWGDLMAAIWSSEDKTKYNYMMFY